MERRTTADVDDVSGTPVGAPVDIPAGPATGGLARTAATAHRLDDGLSDDTELDQPLPNAERLIAEAVTLTEATDEDPDLSTLVAQYWRLVSDEELLGRGPADLRAATVAHLELAEQRLSGELKLRITPADDDTDHTAIEIVTDDMPFLVDSITAALSARDVDIHLLAHPLVVVRREPLGRLVHIAPAWSPRTPTQATRWRAGCASRSTGSATGRCSTTWPPT